MLLAAAAVAAATAVPASARQPRPRREPEHPANPAPAQPPPTPSRTDDRKPNDPARIADAVTKAVDLLLAKQEDMENAKAEPDARAEWPYEGVVRVKGLVPIGYRIGGTANTCVCLLRAPGYADDPRRQAAVARAINFISKETKHPLMSADDWDGGYDVRGWGYTYALAFCLELKAAKAVPADPAETAGKIEGIITWAMDGLKKTEIKGVGGWNYAHSPGRDSACPSSPFMTGPTLQALFEAKRQGYEVDEGMITRAIDALERCRTSTGSFAYAAEKPQNPDRPEPVPGAVGRMLVGEVTLYLAGRSDQARLRGALDAFLAHWTWLDQRRAKPGTHEGPYSIAPYYFYYAHYYAAQAIELLPKGARDQDRKEYRRRLDELLFSVQLEDGSWNDRVFARTSNYGTAMAAMSLIMPSAPAPARFVPAASPAPSLK
jgi:hypothetical protein